MRPFGWIVVRVLLTKTLVKMLVTELHLKLTKFTRRTSEPKDLLHKALAGARFITDMFRYNLEVVRCSRRCLTRLAAQGISEASLFGERHIVEVLCDLAFNAPVKITRIYRECADERTRNGVPVKLSITSAEKIIIASLVDIERKRELLRNRGIDEERLIEIVNNLHYQAGH
jgi:hypothetical protein